MRIRTLIAIVLCIAPLGPAAAGAPLNFDDETNRISYSLGYQIGGDFKRQGAGMNADAVLKGIEDALSGAEPQMKPEDMHSTLIEFKRKIVAEQQARQRESEQQQIAADKKFLEENARKDGVVTTASGLQYRVVDQGKGRTPGATDQVTVNYRGTLVDGHVFDSSYERGKPATFKLDGVIQGWTEGLQQVREGGKINLVIPPALAYGHQGPLADRTLIFDVELLSVGVGQQSGNAGERQAAKGEGARADE